MVDIELKDLEILVDIAFRHVDTDYYQDRNEVFRIQEKYLYKKI